MVKIKKDSQGRYELSYKEKYGEDKGKLKRKFFFNRQTAIYEAGKISSILTKSELRRQLK